MIYTCIKFIRTYITEGIPVDAYRANVAIAMHKQQIIIQNLIDTRWATVNGGVASVFVDGKLPTRARGKKGYLLERFTNLRSLLVIHHD